jgi:hypothetical protein
MYNSKRTAEADVSDRFNFLAYRQTYTDAVARIGLLMTTETGAMAYDLLTFMKARLDLGGNAVDPVDAKVLIAVEQVHRPSIPYLLGKPRLLDVLTGMVYSLNSDVWQASPATNPVALLAQEPGRFAREMDEIAAFIDEAIGSRTRILTGPPRKGTRGMMKFGK